MKNSLILEVTNDEYEFVLNIYDSTHDLAVALNISDINARGKVCPSQRAKHKKTKYVRVWIDDKHEIKGGINGRKKS